LRGGGEKRKRRKGSPFQFGNRDKSEKKGRKKPLAPSRGRPGKKEREGRRGRKKRDLPRC